MFGLRYVAHVAWHILSLATFVIFIVAGVIGLLGIFAMYLPIVVEVVLSPENVSSIFGSDTSSTTTNVLQCCLFEDGNLENYLFPRNSSINVYLDEFYTTSALLKETSNNITNNQNSIVIQNTKTFYVNLTDDITLAPGTDSNSPNIVLDNFNRYTNNRSPNSLQNSCSGKTYDWWVSTASKCPADYVLIDASSAGTRLGQQNCLVFKNWDSSGANSRYATRPSGCTLSGDYSTVASASSAYVTSLNSYASESETLLNNISNDLDG